MPTRIRSVAAATRQVHYPDNEETLHEARRRLAFDELLAIQNAISDEENRPLLGRTVEILVEGPSKTSRKRAETGDTRQLTGRTPCDRIVVFDGPDELIGRIVPVRIEQTSAFTLFGRTK